MDRKPLSRRSERIALRAAAWVCLPFAAAVAACRYLLPERAWIACAAGCLIALIPSSLLRGKARLCAILALCGAAAGCAAFSVQLYAVLRPCETLADERREVGARVTDYPDIYDDSAYVTVRLTEPGLPAVRCRLVSYEEGELDSLVPGDMIRCEVRFSSASVRSGRQVDNLTSQGIFLRAVCVSEPRYTGRWERSFLYAPAAVCRRVVELCGKCFPGDAVPFMTALLTGNKTDLYAAGELYYSLAEAGLSHVVAVSGMHISFLTGFVFLLLGRRRWAVIAAFPILLFFAAMTGFTPSVTRAVFMQICLLSAPLFRREDDALTALSIVLAAILLKNPSAVAGTSLQLSFGAMAGIWLVSGKMYRALTERIGGAPRPFRPVLTFAAAAVSSGLGAQIFTLPIAAARFGYVSAVSPLSNILCLWLISLLYQGGYAAVLLTALMPAAGSAVGGILSWGVRYIRWVTGLLRTLPCACVYMLEPLNALWLAFTYVLFIAAWLRGRNGRGFRLTAPVCLSLIFLYASALTVRLSWDSGMRVTALDVGQGESVVLTCGPRSVVVDCGGSYVTHDAARAAVSFLRAGQRQRVDALILSHLHSDHVNGAEELINRMDVDTLYLPQSPDTDGFLEPILNAARERGTRVRRVTGDMSLTVGDMELTLWAPLLDGDENENCLIVMAGQGDFEVMITGDSPAAAEWLLCARNDLPDTEVLVVGHHGSRTSTCETFLEEIRPDTALISVGYNNYGHPHYEVLRRLKSCHVEIHRTDEEGNITVKAGGDRNG